MLYSFKKNFKKIKNYIAKRFFKREKKIKMEELWKLDYTIVEWLVPRLKLFKEKTIGNPGDITFPEWQNILDKIIEGIEGLKTVRLNFKKN